MPSNHLSSLPELLSPAGDPLALKAAVENGADAVYLGLKNFNARRGAANFSLKELKEAVEYAHLRNVRLYLTFNTLILNEEFKEAFSTLLKAVNLGVDAVIVQDWGLIHLLRQKFPQLRLHASTQLNVHNLQQVKMLEKLGFKRAILARELSLGEIGRLRKFTSLELEVFVHGALCFFYSGHCLFSSMVGGRSGNRGLCTQPCRLSYVLYSGERPFKQVFGRYPLNTRDLCTLSFLPELIKRGVNALKIEGRLKSPDYVGVVTRVYREALDRWQKDPRDFKVLPEEVLKLEQVFTRGFTKSYLLGKDDNTLMSYGRPSNRGVFIGRVSFVDVYTSQVGIKLQKEIYLGDVLDFWVSRGKVTQRVKELSVDGKKRSSVKVGERALITVKKNRHLIKVGDRVFRLESPQLLAKSLLNYRRTPVKRFPVDAIFTLKVGQKPVLQLKDLDGHQVEVTGRVEVEAGRKKPLQEGDLRKRLAKTGQHPYFIREFKLESDEPVFLPISEVNRLRREALRKLDEVRLASWPRNDLAIEVKNIFQEKEVSRPEPTALLAVSLSYFDQAQAACLGDVDWVYVNFLPYDRRKRKKGELKEMVQFLQAHQVKVGLKTPVVLRGVESEEVLEVVNRLKDQLDAVVVGNWGLIHDLNEIGLPLVLDWPLNIFNSQAISFFNQASILRITPSIELNLEQLEDLKKFSQVDLELLVHGRVELSLAQHCILLVLNSDGCRKLCERGHYALVDQAGYRFPLSFDLKCRSHLFNSKTLSLAKEMPKIFASGFRCFRLALDTAEPAEIKRVALLYKKLLELLQAGKAVKDILIDKDALEDTTTGHYFRGVL
jgi:putative protease